MKCLQAGAPAERTRLAYWNLDDGIAAADAWDTALPVLDQIDSDRTAKAATRIREVVAAA